MVRYYEALVTRDNDGETPLDIARGSGACAEIIIGLLSLAPEEARSLGWKEKEMRCLYAPVAWWNYIWVDPLTIVCSLSQVHK